MKAVTSVPAPSTNPAPLNGAGVQPPVETPKPAPGAKLMLVAKELNFANLCTLAAGIIDGLAKDFAKKNARVKEVRDDYKDAAKAAAKVYAVLEIRLNTGKEKNLIAANKSLGDFIKDITGEKPPTHALTLKNAFAGYVMSGLTTEGDFDSNSGNCLELGARILTEVKGDLTHDAVVKATAQLKERSDKEAKNLREILASVKPVEKLTAEDALEMFQRIVQEGQLGVCLAELPDYFSQGMPETDQRENYLAFGRCLERIDVALGEKVDLWTSAAQSEIVLLAAGKAVGQVPPTESTAPVMETEPTAELVAA